MTTYEEALAQILDSAAPIGTERISVFNALGRIISEPLVSRRSLPQWASSAMDGYAVRFADIASVPAPLKVIANVKAGDDVSDITVTPGTAVRIMTGARMPDGADTVVEQEVTETDDDGVRIMKEKKRGANVRMPAEDIAEGDPVDCTGMRITSGHIARLVSTGNVFFSVYRIPKVAVISTGNELCDAADIRPDRLIDANARYIMAMLEEHGIDTAFLGIARDDDDSFTALIDAARSYDAVITSAGISEGDYDVVSMKAPESGVSWMFRGVNQKPGKPFSAGTMRGRPFFALPGNPVAAGVNLFVYVLPALKKMAGLARYENETVEALLSEPVVKKKRRMQFDRIVLRADGARFSAVPFSRQDSHIIDSLSSANALMMLPEDLVGDIAASTEVTCIPFNPGTLLGY